jgi:hypothetical protein
MRKREKWSLGSFARRLTEQARRLLRAAVCLALIGLGVAWFGARAARAQVGEAALGVGRQLAGFEELTESAYRVRLNGEPVNVATSFVAGSIPDVLDRFERHCRDNAVAGDLADVSRALAPAAKGEKAIDPSGIIRRESPREGVVACLVARGGERSLGARFQRFAESLDLADVGLLRYAYVRHTPNGRTHVVLAWTDGAFRLESLIAGGSEDAPGSDVPGAARPVESVRLLTAAVEGAPSGTRIYASRASADVVVDSLDRDLSKLGWKRLLGGPNDPKHTRAHTKNGRDLLTFVYPEKDGSVVSQVESAAK